VNLAPFSHRFGKCLTERFNRTFCEDVLDYHLFACVQDVREAAHVLLIGYNEQLLHESSSSINPRIPTARRWGFYF
jgi:hypothetical protein